MNRYRVRVNEKLWGVFYASTDEEAITRAREHMGNLPVAKQQAIHTIEATLAID